MEIWKFKKIGDPMGHERLKSNFITILLVQAILIYGCTASQEKTECNFSNVKKDVSMFSSMSDHIYIYCMKQPYCCNIMVLILLQIAIKIIFCFNIESLICDS